MFLNRFLKLLCFIDTQLFFFQSTIFNGINSRIYCIFKKKIDGVIYSFTNVVFCLFYIYILSIPKRLTIASLVARRARWSQVLLIGAYPTFGTFKKNYRKLSVTKYFGFGLSSWQFGRLGRLCHADFLPVRISVTLMSHRIDSTPLSVQRASRCFIVFALASLKILVSLCCPSSLVRFSIFCRSLFIAYFCQSADFRPFLAPNFSFQFLTQLTNKVMVFTLTVRLVPFSVNSDRYFQRFW